MPRLEPPKPRLNPLRDTPKNMDEALAFIDWLRAKIDQMKSDNSWRDNPDRMGR